MGHGCSNHESCPCQDRNTLAIVKCTINRNTLVIEDTISKPMRTNTIDLTKDEEGKLLMLKARTAY